MRRIFIFNEDSNDIDYSVITSDETVVIEGKRDDLDNIIDEKINQAGVYLLFSSNLMYIGQSSSNVKDRLKTHKRDKLWWKDFIVITDEHGKLEKTMTEYIEAYFIQTLRTKGVVLDNDTFGNKVIVSKFTELRTKAYIDKAEDIIFNVLHIDLLEKKETANIDETVTNHKVTISDSNGNQFKGSSAIKALESMLLNYSEDFKCSQMLLAEATDSPSSAGLLTDNCYLNPLDFIELIPDSLYLYKKVSKDKALKMISYYAEILDIKVELSY